MAVLVPHGYCEGKGSLDPFPIILKGDNMDLIFNLIIFMLVGGLIGYITNKIAVKMLFRPVKPINLILFKIQGVLPKRKAALSKSIAKTVKEELLNENDILNSLLTEESKSKLKKALEEELIKQVDNFLPAPAKALLGSTLETKLRTAIDENGDLLIERLVNKLKDGSVSYIDIEKLVEEKINKLDFKEIEKIVLNLTRKELRHIEKIGLVLGLAIGLVQFLIFLLVG